MHRSHPLTRAFDLCFALFFALTAAVCLFSHNNPFFPMGPLQLAAALLAVGALVFAASLLWRRYGRPLRHEKAVIGGLLGIWFLVQLAFGLMMRVSLTPSWDYGVVAAAARDFVYQGAAPGDYFALFSNNGPLFWLYAGFFSLLRLCGIGDVVPGLVVLNAAAINLSLGLLYLCARLLLGPKWAPAVLVGALCHPALLLYTPIAYTDTLTLPFVTGAALCWLLARRRQSAGRAALWPAAAAFALAGIGAALKFSVAVLAVAFLLDLLLLWRGRSRFVSAGAGLLCFAVLLAGIGSASSAAMPDFEQEGVPFTHWIMMGLQGDGGYCDADYQLTLQYDSYEARAGFTRQEIARRLGEMGPSGLLSHSLRKLSYIASDGCCYAQEKLNRNPQQVNPLHDFIIPGEPYAGFLAYAADGYQLLLWLLCAAAGLRAFLSKRTRGFFLRLACFGLFLFLLLWEARSRYLVNFLPLYLLCAAGALCPPQEDQTAFTAAGT